MLELNHVRSVLRAWFQWAFPEIFGEFRTPPGVSKSPLTAGSVRAIAAVPSQTSGNEVDFHQFTNGVRKARGPPVSPKTPQSAQRRYC